MASGYLAMKRSLKFLNTLKLNSCYNHTDLNKEIISRISETT